MITILNRRELVVTFSMKEQAQIRESLAAANIKYRMKVVDRNLTSERRSAVGQNPSLQKEYVFYVHKADLQKAKGLLNVR